MNEFEPGFADRDAATRYVEPSGRTGLVMNGIVGALTRFGIAPPGCHELSVPGRASGIRRSTPVNVLDRDGSRFLVSPRGRTQWVRNVRAGGEVRLRRGRRSEGVRLIEIDGRRRDDVVRAYLRRWGWQVSGYVDGLTADASDARIRASAPGLPVFEVLARGGASRGGSGPG